MNINLTIADDNVTCFDETPWWCVTMVIFERWCVVSKINKGETQRLWPTSDKRREINLQSFYIRLSIVSHCTEISIFLVRVLSNLWFRMTHKNRDGRRQLFPTSKHLHEIIYINYTMRIEIMETKTNNIKQLCWCRRLKVILIWGLHNVNPHVVESVRVLAPQQRQI